MERKAQGSNLSVEILAGTIILVGLVLCVQVNFLLFHSLAELFSILVAYSIFVIAWNTRRFHENHFLLFLGIVYLFTGSLDLLHTLAYKGMGIFPTYDANLPTQLWIAARYLESGSLLIAPLFFSRKLPLRLTGSLYTLIFIGILASLFIWPLFPDCYVDGIGLTNFKISSEYIICLLLLGAAVYLYRCRHQLSADIIKLLLASFVLTIFAELSFTFYVSVYGISNIVGHFCKLISFYLIYRALIQTGLSRPVELLFNRLEESKETYQDLYDRAPVAYFSISADGLILKANQKASELLGFSLEELVGREVLSLYAEDADGHEKARQVFERFLTGEEVDSEELRMLRVDGTPIWVNLTVKILRDADGDILESRSIVIDINEYKRIEQLQRESEQEITDLYDNAPDMFASIEAATGKVLRCNQTAATRLGYTKQKIIGRPIKDLYHPDCEIKRQGMFATFVETGEVHDCELQLMCKDGSPLDVSVNVSSVHDEQGKVLYSRSIWRDITKRKQAETALQESEYRFRQIFDTMTNGAVIYTVVGNGDDFIIKDMNPAGVKISHVCKEEIIGKSIQEVFPGVIALGLFAVLQRAWRTGQEEHHPISLYQEDKLSYWVENFVFRLPNREIVAIYEDISERKQAEAKLQRSLQQLTTANEDLAQFSYVVAHDLKAPFRAVGNYSRFLQDDLADQLSDQQQLYLTKMMAAVSEADNLLEQMLSIARIRHHELDLQPVEMKDFLEKLCVSLDFPADVEVQIADNLPTITNDPQLLRQIFQNLIVNGATYNHSDHKQMTIAWQKRTDGGIDCSVRDNGIGIAPQYQEKIFNMFERLHAPGEYPGSGVGLAIVKKAVEKLGGSIRLETAEGRGTTFYISLPSNESNGSPTQELT